jgi:hypothetical protein
VRSYAAAAVTRASAALALRAEPFAARSRDDQVAVRDHGRRAWLRAAGGLHVGDRGAPPRGEDCAPRGPLRAPDTPCSRVWPTLTRSDARRLPRRTQAYPYLHIRNKRFPWCATRTRGPRAWATLRAHAFALPNSLPVLTPCAAGAPTSASSRSRRRLTRSTATTRRAIGPKPHARARVKKIQKGWNNRQTCRCSVPVLCTHPETHPVGRQQ